MPHLSLWTEPSGLDSPPRRNGLLDTHHISVLACRNKSGTCQTDFGIISNHSILLLWVFFSLSATVLPPGKILSLPDSLSLSHLLVEEVYHLSSSELMIKSRFLALFVFVGESFSRP